MHVVINEGWSNFGDIEAKFSIPHFSDISFEERAVLNVTTGTIEVLSVDIDSAEFAGEVYMVQVNVCLIPDTSEFEHLGAVPLDGVRICVGLSRDKGEIGHVRDLADFYM